MPFLLFFYSVILGCNNNIFEIESEKQTPSVNTKEKLKHFLDSFLLYASSASNETSKKAVP